MNSSVIIPCHDAEKTIAAAIEALLAQTKKPDEIIIVDDGSTDSTRSTVESFGKRVKYIHQKKRGPAAARNLGARTAHFEIILFTDADCIPEKNWVKEMVGPFADKKVSGVQGAYKTKQKGLIPRFAQIEIEERYERMKKAKELDWIGSYSAAVRRKEFLELKGYDESFPVASGEDPEFSFRLVKKGGKLVFNPNAIVYHKHPTSLGKYLRTKFFRAFYRPKMYSKHKEKAISDSYTPQVLKLQIIIAGLTILSVFASLWAGFFAATFFALVFLISNIPFFAFSWRKDKKVAAVSPLIIFLRSIVFGIGLVLGAISG